MIEAATELQAAASLWAKRPADSFASCWHSCWMAGPSPDKNTPGAKREVGGLSFGVLLLGVDGDRFITPNVVRVAQGRIALCRRSSGADGLRSRRGATFVPNRRGAATRQASRGSVLRRAKVAAVLRLMAVELGMFSRNPELECQQRVARQPAVQFMRSKCRLPLAITTLWLGGLSEQWRHRWPSSSSG
jgi:hypothetical protein